MVGTSGDQQGPDPFADLTRLCREAAGLAHRLELAGAAAEQATGRDTSEQVRVTISAAGRITSVEIAPAWRTVLSPPELGAAIVAAYQEATRRCVETWAAEISRPPAETLDDGGPLPASTGRPPAAGSEPVGRVADESIRELWYVLQDATDRLDELTRGIEARARAQVRGQDPDGHVTVMLAGGQPTGVELDEQWLARADGREIGTAVRAAIHAGYAAADRLAADSPRTGWPFAQLERLTADPTSVLTQLGLRTGGQVPDEREGT